MELMRKEKANPLMGCLPLLIQGPIFIAVFHVLRHLKPTQPEANKGLYGWTITQFDKAADAKLFGAPIAASIKSSTADLAALGASRTNVTIVAGNLIAVMIVTTYMTSRQMILRTGRATDPTQRMMQNMMMYFIPVSLLVSGSIFPIGAVIYYVTTNFFSLGQQFYVLRKFPPPPVTDTAPSFGNLFNRNKDAAPAKTAAGISARTGGSGKTATKAAAGKGSAKDAKNKNGQPAVEVRAVGPKVGAKPINPKKGNPTKR